MEMIPAFLKEMEQEAVTTRKMLSRIPDDKYDWKPHPKSMSIRQLATHIAELPTWPTMILGTDELDFTTMEYKPVVINDTASLLALFEKSYAAGHDALNRATVEQLSQTWTLRSGDHIHSADNKAENIRMSFCQTVHHRAQLGVFLRLLDVPIPGSYGPSADDPSF
ncbi:MAG TPA: DinB family protein [Arachidicoccus sp.]|nr:DinB family protein [Arachidicoccus sp.]